MKNIFDYMFYSLAKINYNGKNSERVTVSLSVVQSLLLINAIIFIYGMILGSFPEVSKIIIGIVFFSSCFLFDIYNKKKYKRKYQEFNRRWKSDNLFLKILKFSGIIVFIILSWCLFLVNYLLFR